MLAPALQHAANNQPLTRATSARAGEAFADIDKALDERTIGHNPGRLNLMKGGIVFSNAVTTVSPTYAEEARSGGAAGYLRTLINEPRISQKVRWRCDWMLLF
jgi:glycogen synthase